MYRTQIVAWLIVIMAALLAAVPGVAMEPGQYASGAGAKLGRGALSTPTGWGEISKQTVLGRQENGALGGGGGFFKGIALGVARTLAGAFEIVTFWAPVPERFEPVMPPPTGFDTATTRAGTGTGSYVPSQ